jgi:hypothetical protein
MAILKQADNGVPIPQVKKEVCGRTLKGRGYPRGHGKKVIKASERKLMRKKS